MNTRYGKDKTKKMLPVIAKAAGMDADTASKTMTGFSFPGIEEQLSKKWLGGGTQQFL